MKKIISVLFILILAMIFTACGNNNTNIEECSWQLQSVTKLNEKNESFSVSGITLKAQNGEIIIEDAVNDETYKGAYEEMLVTEIPDDYKVILEGKEGYMSISETENGETSLLLTVDNYDLFFSVK